MVASKDSVLSDFGLDIILTATLEVSDKPQMCEPVPKEAICSHDYKFGHTFENMETDEYLVSKIDAFTKHCSIKK